MVAYNKHLLFSKHGINIKVMFRTFTLTHSKMCAVTHMAVFVVSWFHALLVCCSTTVWVILRWFQVPLLFQVSLLFLH